MQMNGMNGNMDAVRPTPRRNDIRSLPKNRTASSPISTISVMPARATASSVATAEYSRRPCSTPSLARDSLKVGTNAAARAPSPNNRRNTFEITKP